MPYPYSDMKYPPMLTRCGVYDSSPGRSILLKHKDKGFIPSTPMPAHNATHRQVCDFFLTILLERQVPAESAKYIALCWYGDGLQLHTESFDTYRCWFKDKNAQVIYRDVHAIIRPESKARQRIRDARRRRANLAKGEFFPPTNLDVESENGIRENKSRKLTSIFFFLQCPDFS